MTPSHVRDLRERLGLTQRELAAAVGVDIRTVQRWEDRRRWLNPDGSERDITMHQLQRRSIQRVARTATTR